MNSSIVKEFHKKYVAYDLRKKSLQTSKDKEKFLRRRIFIFQRGENQWWTLCQMLGGGSNGLFLLFSNERSLF